jgi:hypothetical protein
MAQRTLAILDGRDARGTGLGLGAFRLIRLPKDGSLRDVGRPAAPGATVLGLDALRIGAVAFDGGREGCNIVTVVGLTNIPLLGEQSKYRSPCTDPSFLPKPSSSSTPIQSPTAKWVCPTKRTVALRPSLSRMDCPTAISDIVVLPFGLCWVG